MNIATKYVRVLPIDMLPNKEPKACHTRNRNENTTVIVACMEWGLS